MLVFVLDLYPWLGPRVLAFPYSIDVAARCFICGMISDLLPARLLTAQSRLHQ